MRVKDGLTRLCQSVALGSILVAATDMAHAQLREANEYVDRIKTTRTVQPLGENPFGEQINMVTGGLSFTQTDIVIPGIGPDILIERRFQAGSRNLKDAFHPGMEDWEFVVPQLTSIVLPPSSLGPAFPGFV
ncbi:MAG: hypothetical protein KDI75_04800, partial [Xanthomonadales bacterium]|nr:hypothetical protein [Xanthomonadales bacterium]